jgi:hypothetical protein
MNRKKVMAKSLTASEEIGNVIERKYFVKQRHFRGWRLAKSVGLRPPPRRCAQPQPGHEARMAMKKRNGDGHGSC